MEILDNVEGHLYYRQSAQAIAYERGREPDKNDPTKEVIVYCRKVESISKVQGEPQERYLDIMLEGAQHYGLAVSAIQELHW